MDAYVQLTGNVGGAVEFHNKTVPIASFRLAHTPRVRRQGEWVDAPTTWITVTCFRSLAANVASSVLKGQPVIVAGRLRTNVWTKENVTYERLILEATAVGHDLTWGTAGFRRNERISPAEDQHESVGEVVHRVETQGADQPGEFQEDAPTSPTSLEEPGLAIGGDASSANEQGANGQGANGQGADEQGANEQGVGRAA